MRGAHIRTTRARGKRRRRSSRRHAARGAHAPRQKDVLSAIGYDALYADGTAQVEEGLFSQTIEFGDISYQSAREENQQSVFAAMSELYDYFGAETSVQLTITNTPIRGREDRAQAFLREERPARRRIRRGVQPHPQRQDARGGFESRAPPLPHLPRGGGRHRRSTAPRLARARGATCSRRSRASAAGAHARRGRASRAHPVAAAPGIEPAFSWDKLSHESGLRTKDLIAPSVLDFKPEGALTVTAQTEPGAA